VTAYEGSVILACDGIGLKLTFDGREQRPKVAQWRAVKKQCFDQE